MATKTALTRTKGEQRNGSIPRPSRGMAAEMWNTFDASPKTEHDTTTLTALAKKRGWAFKLVRFHYAEWGVFTGKRTRRAWAPVKKKATPAKKSAPAKKATPKKKTAARKKAPAKKVNGAEA